jgi:hypothetical protein
MGGNSRPVQELVAALPAPIVTAIVLSFAEMNEDDLQSFVKDTDR